MYAIIRFIINNLNHAHNAIVPKFQMVVDYTENLSHKYHNWKRWDGQLYKGGCLLGLLGVMCVCVYDFVCVTYIMVLYSLHVSRMF